VFFSIFKHGLIFSLFCLVATSFPAKVRANPAQVFRPHLEEIKASLPPGLKMRLPSRILLGSGSVYIDPNELVVRIFPSQLPAALTVGLFTCYEGSHPCLVGTLSVDKMNSPRVMGQWQRYRQQGDPITLASEVKGYIMEGDRLSSPFSTIMWQQDNAIYAASFLQAERQNILFMASSMARLAPLKPN